MGRETELGDPNNDAPDAPTQPQPQPPPQPQSPYSYSPPIEPRNQWAAPGWAQGTPPHWFEPIPGQERRRPRRGRGGSYLIEMGMKDHAKALAGGEVDVETAEKAVEFMRKGWGIVEKNQERISTLVMDMLTFSKEREPVPEPKSSIPSQATQLPLPRTWDGHGSSTTSYSDI